ncbi:MAG: bacteriorhodopsin, partial [Catalinimonas sp.]
MENMENIFSYTSVQYELIAHILVFGVGAQLAGLVYFVLTMKNTAPRYRLSSALSAVVMVSAALILYNQQISWSNAFVWNGAAKLWEPAPEANFSNGYRYVNWSIDVPMLLTQLLIVLGISGADFRKKWISFVIGGLLMIWTGYVGQFYEQTSIAKLFVWGGISTVFMVWVCWIVGDTIFRTAPAMPGSTGQMAKTVFWLLIISWTLYPIAYLVPWFAPSADGMVIRQYCYTFADVVSKVVYGAILTQMATERSALEGFEPARASLGMNDGVVAADSVRI